MTQNFPQLYPQLNETSKKALKFYKLIGQTLQTTYAMTDIFVEVALDVPLDIHFDYRYGNTLQALLPPQVGLLVRVPLQERQVTGLIVDVKTTTQFDVTKVREVLEVIKDVPIFSDTWLKLCRFAATYYHRMLGEVILPAIPKYIRENNQTAIGKAQKKLSTSITSKHKKSEQPIIPVLREAQAQAVDTVLAARGFETFVLHGITGSGKTEVYLNIIEKILARDARAQVLVMIPEINLTPQLENAVQQRFPQTRIATLHSSLTESKRLLHWLSIAQGQAQIILGTRMSILAPIPHLSAIIVDEEHDTSYKQQEGLRYSARDLAVWRAHQLGIPVILGSATPSLETWQHILAGHYKKLSLPDRAVENAAPAQVKLVNVANETLTEGISNWVFRAIEKRIEKQELSLLFLNRRGYAPVITCHACGWVSACPNCSAYMVYHKAGRLLRCHHCGAERRIPHQCPDCGYTDLNPIGRGTQRVEEGLKQRFPNARVLRLDADSVSRKGEMEKCLARIRAHEVDIVIGTQMVSKGHDFDNLTLVAVLGADSALFSHDFRANERLFAQLIQVAGRAGRRATQQNGNPSEVLIQTRYPDHPLLQSVLHNRYEQYVNTLLQERQEAILPPFAYQALLVAQAKELETAINFLQIATSFIKDYSGITVNQPVPMNIVRVANQERAQLLVESQSRATLQAMLGFWLEKIRGLKTRAQWHIEVDPLSI